MTSTKANVHPSRDQIPQELFQSLNNAQKDGDLTRMVEICQLIIQANPSDIAAKKLLAMYTGWNEKLCSLNGNTVLSSISSFFENSLIDNAFCYANKIYLARKKQLICAIESESSMPTFTTAKNIHTIMLLWLRLIQNIPYLSSVILTNELRTIELLCERSRNGIDPKSRILYTSYATFNKKTPYHVTFSSSLKRTLEHNTRVEQETLNDIFDHIKLYEKILDEPNNLDQKKQLGTNGKTKLENDIEIIKSINGISYFQEELNVLESQFSACKPYSLARKKKLSRSIDVVTKKLTDINKSIDAQIQPIRSLISKIEIMHQA